MDLLCCLYSETTYSEWLDEDTRSRCYRRIPRCTSKTYVYRSFWYIFKSGNDQALINTTFAPVYMYWTFDENPTKIRWEVVDANGFTKRKSRDMTVYGYLRLVLVWVWTRGLCARILSMMFRQTSTPSYIWLNFWSSCRW